MRSANASGAYGQACGWFHGALNPEQTLESTRTNWTWRQSKQLDTVGILRVRAVACAALGGLIFLVLSVANVDWLQRIGMTVVFALLASCCRSVAGQKIRSRKNSVIRSLPDALDLLTICVEAGLGLTRRCRKWPRNGMTSSAGPLRGAARDSPRQDAPRSAA